MDDLEVIRLVAMENITRGRIARARMEVKENFGDKGGGAASGLPGPSTGFLLVRGISFAGETPVPWKKVRTLASRISWVSAHKPAEFVFAKRRLEQVRPDSAFWSSEMSMGVMWKP